MKITKQKFGGLSAEEIQKLCDWLRNEAEECMKRANGRRDSAECMRSATAEELRVGKKMAERMARRKLNLVSTAVEAAQKSAGIDERIAAKLEGEARQLSAWAEALPDLLTALADAQMKISENEKRGRNETGN